MSISATDFAVRPGISIEEAFGVVAPPKCGAEIAISCAIVGGAYLTLEASLAVGQCCCCRGDHSAGCLDG